MKLFIKTILLFFVTYLCAIFIRELIDPYLSRPYLKIVFNFLLLLSFSALIIIIGNNKWKLFKTNRLERHYLGLLFFLVVLFGINNYLMLLYSDNHFYSKALKSALGIYVLSYVISSISEEVIYRGFIQTFINRNTIPNSSKISKGNIFATVLFFIAHLGFFTVMDPIFAITSLINVVLFSLTVGYLRDRTKSILLPILVHILINLLHVFIQVKL